MNVESEGYYVLLPHAPVNAYFTAFGHRWVDNNVDNDCVDFRYTDHEYDQFSGFNYMKGRYQLPQHAKFNRPDPMRDWDWLRPNTINLYQYCGNDPVNLWDPTGLVIRESESLAENELWQAYKQALLSTDAGQQLWSHLDEGTTAVFTIQFADLSTNQVGLVDNYQVDEAGVLLSADINFDLQQMTGSGALNTGSTGPGEVYEGIIQFNNGTVDRIAAVGHELAHGEFALAPGTAQLLAEKEMRNIDVRSLHQECPRTPEGRAELAQIFNSMIGEDRKMDERISYESEQHAVHAGTNPVGLQFRQLPRPERIALIRAIREARNNQ